MEKIFNILKLNLIKYWNSLKMKKFIVATIFLSVNSAYAEDYINVDGEKHSYKGGRVALCKDYEILITLEKQRIEDQKRNVKSKITSNDNLSAVFRFMGIMERIDNERVSKILNDCKD
jgi:hypothetical protein